MISKPGDTILETLEQIPLGVEHFKLYLNNIRQKINYDDLLSGKHKIDINTANILHDYFNIDVQFWLNRERDYRAKLAMLNEFNSILDRRIKELCPLHSSTKIQTKLLNSIKQEINAD